jgi:hypothetical protein|tara:strand:- start:60 stop:689 length:630 start_codon:yes stop_codon:yes gene_type:complete
MVSLELFCGTKSFSKIVKNYVSKTVTTDMNNKFEPSICDDIFNLNFKEKEFDIIWASPPCEGFSVASIGHHWNPDHTPKTKKAEEALRIVKKTIEIIKNVKPKYWFIENPRGKLRKVIDDILLDNIGNYYKRETVCYCRYGDTRMKPTDIWTNCFEWKPIDKMCKNGNLDHEAAPRGSKTGTQGLKDYELRSIIPPALFEDIFKELKEL